MTISERAIHIRPAESADDWAVERLFGALHAFNASLDPRFALAEGWERLLAEHQSRVRAANRGITLLAWDDSNPVGLIMLDGHSDSPLFQHRHWVELLALYVMPETRGGAVARQLVDAGTAWAIERGYDRIQLYVTASNERAKQFYQRVGFRPVQEIWRLELENPVGTPLEDPDCAAIHAHGHDLLSVSAHQLAIDEKQRDSEG